MPADDDAGVDEAAAGAVAASADAAAAVAGESAEVLAEVRAGAFLPVETEAPAERDRAIFRVVEALPFVESDAVLAACCGAASVDDFVFLRAGLPPVSEVVTDDFDAAAPAAFVRLADLVFRAEPVVGLEAASPAFAGFSDVTCDPVSCVTFLPVSSVSLAMARFPP